MRDNLHMSNLHIGGQLDGLPAHEDNLYKRATTLMRDHLLLETSNTGKVRSEFHYSQLKELLVHNTT